MLNAAGYKIILDIEPDPSCYRLADLAIDLRGVQPDDTERFDALLATIAEDLSRQMEGDVMVWSYGPTIIVRHERV